MAKRRNGHLRVRIEREQIVISIGVALLPHVVNTDLYGAYNDAKDEWEYPKVTDPDVFAKEVVRELLQEEEDGTTLVHKMFDAAINEAIENGAEGIDVPSPAPL